MIVRLLTGGLVLALAACASPVAEAPTPEAPAEEVTACREIIRSAAMQAYSLARYRDDQRAVILLPAGKAAAEYEAETKRLRDDGAWLMAELERAYPEAAEMPPMPAVQPGSLTQAQVVDRIAEAETCLRSGGK
jgi:uncharacterized protein (DUF2342 family)